MNKDLSMQVVDLRKRLRCYNSNDDDSSNDSSDADGTTRSFDLSGVTDNTNVGSIDACIAAADQVSRFKRSSTMAWG